MPRDERAYGCGAKRASFPGDRGPKRVLCGPRARPLEKRAGFTQRPQPLDGSAPFRPATARRPREEGSPGAGSGGRARSARAGGPERRRDPHSDSCLVRLRSRLTLALLMPLPFPPPPPARSLAVVGRGGSAGKKRTKRWEAVSGLMGVKRAGREEMPGHPLKNRARVWWEYQLLSRPSSTSGLEVFR